MKTMVILTLLGALAGVVIASYVVPPALTWYASPGGQPQGAQTLVQVPEVIRYATAKLIRWQAIAGGVGAGMGLALGIVLAIRRRQSRHVPQAAKAPAAPPSASAPH